jgi:hypothetical protein
LPHGGGHVQIQVYTKRDGQLAVVDDGSFVFKPAQFTVNVESDERWLSGSTNTGQQPR